MKRIEFFILIFGLPLQLQRIFKRLKYCEKWWGEIRELLTRYLEWFWCCQDLIMIVCPLNWVCFSRDKIDLTSIPEMILWWEWSIGFSFVCFHYSSSIVPTCLKSFGQKRYDSSLLLTIYLILMLWLLDTRAV